MDLFLAYLIGFAFGYWLAHRHARNVSFIWRDPPGEIEEINANRRERVYG